MGGGVTIFEGVQHTRRPDSLRDPRWNDIVLAAATAFEGASFAIALRQFLKDKPFNDAFWVVAIHRSKDPTTYTVLAEASAALVGLVIAAIAIALSHCLNLPELDGTASVHIGLLLAAVAILLIRESRGLLIGEGIRRETASAIRDMALAQPKVCDVGRVLSMYAGPDDVLLTMDLDFDDGTALAEAALAIWEVERQVRERYPVIRRLFIELGTPPPQSRWSGPDSTQTPAASA